MKKVVKVFHPHFDNSIFCKKALEKYNDYQVIIHEENNFDIKSDIELLKIGVEMVILFPFWWYNPPGNFKVWLDLVAFDDVNKYPKSKIKLHVTVGGSQERYENGEKYNVSQLLNNLEMTFDYLEIEFLGIVIDYDCV